MAFLLNVPSTAELQARSATGIAPAPTPAPTHAVQPAPAPAEAPQPAVQPPATVEVSERKKLSQLEELDPWAYYTQGPLLGEGTYAKVYACTDKETGAQHGGSCPSAVRA